MHAFSCSEYWPDWSALPISLLVAVAERFAGVNINDYLLFGRVCVSWQKVIHKKFANNIFMLIALSSQDQKALYNLSEKVIYNFKLNLPKLDHHVRSPSGWVITTEENLFCKNHVKLRNPFFNQIIHLPQIDTKEHYAIMKVAVSCDPLWSDKFVVMAITCYAGGAAFCRKGDKTWTSIRTNLKLLEDTENSKNPKYYNCEDVIFCRRTKQFYILLGSGKVVAVEFTKRETKFNLEQVAPPLKSEWCESEWLWHEKMHLVEDLSSGELLQIRRNRSEFNIFKLAGVERCWVKMDGIGNKVLFLSIFNNSMICSASDCPDYPPNCICYGTMRSMQMDANSDFLRIHNMENGTDQPHHTVNPLKFMVSSTWLVPFPD